MSPFLRSSALAAWLLSTLAGCGPRQEVALEQMKYDTRVLATSRSGSELEGHKLYAQKCSVCHVGNAGETPFGGWMNRQRIQLIGKDVARERIMNGTPQMPGWKYTLTPAQLDRILAYIQTVTTTKVVVPPPEARKDLSER